MNPDPQQPQNVPTPLPEVPQINTPEPTPVVEAPTAEQPSAVVMQTPESQVENQIVSETAQPAQVAPEVPESVVEPVVNQPTEAPIQPEQPPVNTVPAEGSVTPPPVEHQPLTNSTFPQATPASPLEQFNLSESPAPVAPAPALPVAPKKSKLWLIIGIIAGLLVLVTAVALAWYFLVFTVGKVAESDLVSSTTDGTSYLHPKEWQSVSVSGFTGYGDKKGKDGASTAGIFIQKKNYVASGIKSSSTTNLDKLRTTVLAGMTIASAGEVVKTYGVCSSVEDVTVKKSTVATANMVGLVRVDATCKRDTSTYKVALYTTLGDDGYLRAVMFMSTLSLWNLNQPVFNKMIDSVDQS